jgi:KDO2-lipid IV(A) lauroyltransferase
VSVSGIALVHYLFDTPPKIGHSYGKFFLRQVDRLTVSAFRMGRRKKRVSIFKRVKNFTGWLMARAAFLVVEHVSLSFLERFGETLGTMGYYVLGRRKGFAYRNLELALGAEKSNGELRSMLKSNFRHMGMNVVEIAKARTISEEKLRGMGDIEGIEHLNGALEGGKGAIALSAHLGNFPYLCMRLATEGYPWFTIVRNPRDERVARLLTDLRGHFGIFSIPDKPKRMCVAKSMECLKKNGVLFLQIDVNASSDDLWVEFFGWAVPTFKGPVVFSLRTGAPIVPMFVTRDVTGRHQIVIEPSFAMERTGDREQDTYSNTLRLSKITESRIRQSADQWWWVHRRWKKARRLPAADARQG